MAGLDLKNPGGKEIVIFAGGATGLALIYFALSKKSTATPAQTTPQSTPGTGGGLGSTGTASTTGGVGTAGVTTGNVFSDLASSVPASMATASTGVSAAPARVQGVRTTQGAGEILGSGGVSPGGSPSPGGGSIPSYTGPTPNEAAVYQALVKAGLQPFQAAGIMGNIQNESSFQVENNTGDNGTSYGLVQWHSAIYNPSQYVTGNVKADFARQISSIVQLFHNLRIGGTTAAQVAGNWAAQFEGCRGCQPGGAQWSQRMANATAIFQAIQAGKFNPPKPKPVISPGVKAITPKAAAGLFPIASPSTKPVANRTPVAKAKPKPAARPASYSAGYRGEKRVGY